MWGTLWKDEDLSWSRSGAPAPFVPVPSGPLTLQNKPLGTYQGDVFQIDQALPASGANVAFQFSGSIYEVAPLSGVRQYPTVPYVYTTYEDNQLRYEGNQAEFGNQDRVPMFIYYGGDVKYARDRAGNVIAGNPDKPKGSQ